MPRPRDGVVHVKALRLYAEVVRDLGGEPDELLAQEHIDPSALLATDAYISYRSVIQLLERTATAINCPDFGIRLAERQGGMADMGPLEVAMRSSLTIGEAYRHCANHLQLYSAQAQVRIEEDRVTRRQFMNLEILLDGIRISRQTVENALALTHQAILTLSQGRFGAREVWFTHERIAPLAVYQRFFGVPVYFCRTLNAVFLDAGDVVQPIVNKDRQNCANPIHDIDAPLPAGWVHLTDRVRSITANVLLSSRGKACTHVEVASRLNMHPRTLQRRLRDEETSFEAIRDDVRKDAAVRYLSRPDLPVSRVATLLGYSEPSVLTRSCRRWFSSSPRQIRESARPGRSQLQNR